MPATFTINNANSSKAGADTQTWDDPMIDRIIAYSQATFKNSDGSSPGPNAALNRLSNDVMKQIRDKTRTWEHMQNVAAVPPPADIPVSGG